VSPLPLGDGAVEEEKKTVVSSSLNLKRRKKVNVVVRAVKPDSLNPDPYRDRDPDPAGFWWPKTEEQKYNKIFLFFFWSKIAFSYFKLQEKPSALKREHPAVKFFQCLWVIFALLDTDPDCESGSRYGSRDPIESGSTALALVDPA
jgi:hypothetical protein